MKLRNKKTGEIGELQVTEKHCVVAVRNGTANCGVEIYSSLARLYEEWEDVPEEPKVGYIIDPMEEDYVAADDSGYEEDDVERAKELGIWFETEKEAEKTVEKLKAWRRLKDYNVKFNLDFVKNKIYFNYTINNPLLDVLDGEEQIFNNMKIVFGGEE